ncbi:MAG: bifunctional DNA-formamidopyrimidine glycosylase/DNA-(apurinic or apyrimidinic site) lyase [Bdellovibrionaceae bacterium]|nr:bifunctional DNA-formamidopyrimidine glycosylase/DNA-(apurinic or apyrimidinic site) lyase [Pseudobdellovibrionaceae bacterium]
MPELPEVESIRRGLETLLLDQPVIRRFEFARKDLRDPIPVRQLRSLEGQAIRAVLRRSKYLFLAAETGGVLSHLGMTGSWRTATDPKVLPGPHDHVRIEFETGLTLIYRDPRRFGVLDWAKDLTSAHPRLDLLGPEPFDPAFSPEYLHQKARTHRSPIKNLLMNAKIVVGVGNIYASEILFRAGVRPGRSSERVTAVEAARIKAFTTEVLAESIAAGGSSISDYVDASGDQGGFQNHFRVYDRAGKPCLACGTPIRRDVHAGRSSFFCPRCQR